MNARQEPRAVPRARRANVEAGPFHGAVLDLGFADRNQLELFAAVGRTKGPFRGVIDWPYLNGRVQELSNRLLLDEGEDAWKAAGGVYGDNGKPTFSVRSSNAAVIVREIAEAPGGFVWTDARGTGWAVRLATVATGEPGAYAGLAVSWDGGGRVIDPLAREEYRRAVEERMAELPADGELETRSRLGRIAQRMWLYERGEQLLWAVYAAVLMQRRSVVLLPDVALGEVVWGGDRSRWPDNWRGALTDVLGSLSQLHLAMLHVGGVAWRPQFTMRSAAVASYEHLERNRGGAGFCRPACPLWDRSAPHGHFLVQIGYGFLGLLEGFSIRANQGIRQPDPFFVKGMAVTRSRKTPKRIAISPKAGRPVAKGAVQFDWRRHWSKKVAPYLKEVMVQGSLDYGMRLLDRKWKRGDAPWALGDREGKRIVKGKLSWYQPLNHCHQIAFFSMAIGVLNYPDLDRRFVSSDSHTVPVGYGADGAPRVVMDILPFDVHSAEESIALARQKFPRSWLDQDDREKWDGHKQRYLAIVVPGLKTMGLELRERKGGSGSRARGRRKGGGSARSG